MMMYIEKLSLRRRVETLVDLKWNEKWHTDFEFMEVSDVKFGVVTLSLKTCKGCRIEDTVALSEYLFKTLKSDLSEVEAVVIRQ